MVAKEVFFQYNVYKWHGDLPSADKHLNIDRGGTKTILGPAGAFSILTIHHWVVTEAQVTIQCSTFGV